ncbi:hypothetical protein CPC08DRAFT_770302 [Agrocybe pediades]|nr:hypothetical protein CPC08DRAFT_770302 [Agrocybe pediades]
MSQALQASQADSRKNGASQRVSTAYRNDMEASACPREIHYSVRDDTSHWVVARQATGQVPVDNAALPAINSSERESSISTLIFALTWIYTKATDIVRAAVFPASNWFYYLFYCAPDEGVADQSQHEYLVRWELALTSIGRSWKDTQSLATSLLLASALAILQLNGALNDRAICTCISTAILLALASILSSFVYLLSKQRFISRWKTSETPDPSFWKCVGMPLDFAIW